MKPNDGSGEWASRRFRPSAPSKPSDVLLGGGSAQAIVANVNWTRFKELYEATGPRPLLEQIKAQPRVEPRI